MWTARENATLEKELQTSSAQYKRLRSSQLIRKETYREEVWHQLQTSNQELQDKCKQVEWMDIELGKLMFCANQMNAMLQKSGENGLSNDETETMKKLLNDNYVFIDENNKRPFREQLADQLCR